jgi:hypothetical protein
MTQQEVQTLVESIEEIPVPDEIVDGKQGMQAFATLTSDYAERMTAYDQSRINCPMVRIDLRLSDL